MTIRDLRNCLFEVREQDQEIDIDDVGRLMGLWERSLSIEHKVDDLLDEQQVSMEFIKCWQKERAETLKEIRSYKTK